jgi:hypothetical protein
LESPTIVIEECRKNAMSLVRDLYKPTETVIVTSKPPGTMIRLQPGRRKTIVYIDPLLSKNQLTGELLLDVILGYKRSRRMKMVWDTISILGLLAIGSLGKQLNGALSIIAYLATLTGFAFIAATYIGNIAGRKKSLSRNRFKLQVVQGDTFCREAIESMRKYLEWIIDERDEHLRSMASRKTRVKWKRTHIPLNPYRDIVKEYPVMASASRLDSSQGLNR